MSDMMLREMQLSMKFPGFKFSPTDEELISYYLKKKIEGDDSCVQVIQEVDLCQFEPWELPEKSVIQSSSEWFFFSSRGRKYPNGLQSKRATECGYWKATGKERNVKSGSDVIGTKRTLVFHKGRAPKGERTEWIMHEYCMAGNSQDTLVVCRLRKNNDFQVSENPRRASQHQSGDNNSYENDRAVDGCYSSYNSHSVDSESESNQNTAHHQIPQTDGPVDGHADGHVDGHADGHVDHKEEDGEDGEAEEDCFAEILNDDIIKLDESSSPDNSNFIGAEIKRREVRPKVGSDSVPSQGAANRRIRLHIMEADSYQIDSTQELHVRKDDIAVMSRLQTLRRVFVIILVVFAFISLSFAIY